jgi:hypothetical protein
MTVFERLRMPSLGGAEWLNSEPLGPAERIADGAPA